MSGGFAGLTSIVSLVAVGLGLAMMVGGGGATWYGRSRHDKTRSIGGARLLLRGASVAVLGIGLYLVVLDILILNVVGAVLMVQAIAMAMLGGQLSIPEQRDK